MLGPLPFSLYIRDIDGGFDSALTFKHFADDAVIYSNISSIGDQQKLHRHLRKIVTWCDRWQMYLNVKNTVYMNVTRRKQALEYK